MITTDLLPDLERLGRDGGYRPRMLILGAQESKVPGFATARDWFARWVGDEYDDLDLEDGALRLDLNADLHELSARYATVFNLGTIEHCWDANRAWCNALRSVALGGSFLTHSPVGGWVDERGCVNHGVHMTTADAIRAFVELNGFEVLDSWVSQFRHRGLILWLRAEKRRHTPLLEDFRPVLQVRGLSSTYRSTR